MDFILAKGIEDILIFGIQLASETAVKRVAEVLDRSLSVLLKKSEIMETNDETGPEEMKIDKSSKNKVNFERDATDEEVSDTKESPHIKVTDYISSGDNVDGQCTNDLKENLFVDAESTEDCLKGKASFGTDSLDGNFAIAKDTATVPKGYFREDPIEDVLSPYLISPTYHEIAQRYTGWNRKRSEVTTDVALAPYLISSTDPIAVTSSLVDTQEREFSVSDTKTSAELFRSNKSENNLVGSSSGTDSIHCNLTIAKEAPKVYFRALNEDTSDEVLCFYFDKSMYPEAVHIYVQSITKKINSLTRVDAPEDREFKESNLHTDIALSDKSGDVLASYLISSTCHETARRYTGWIRTRCKDTTDDVLVPYLISSTDPIAVPMPSFVDTPKTREFRKSSLANTFRLSDTKTMAGLFNCEISENVVGSSSGSDFIECNLTLEKAAATLPKGYFCALSEDTRDKVISLYFDNAKHPRRS